MYMHIRCMICGKRRLRNDRWLTRIPGMDFYCEYNSPPSTSLAFININEYNL